MLMIAPCSAQSPIDVYINAGNTNEQINSTLQLIQGITTLAEIYARKNMTYENLSNTIIAPDLPKGADSFKTAWGGNVVITEATKNSYSATISQMPSGVCTGMVTRLKSNPNYTTNTTCNTNGAVSFQYTYTSPTQRDITLP